MVQTIGTKVETPNKIIVELSDGEYQFSKTINGLVMPEGLNPRNYAMIGSVKVENGVASYNSDSTISMVQGFNNFKYEPAHVGALKTGLIASPPAQFMPHVRNVNLALNKQGVLYDAVGNLIEWERLEKYAHTLNYSHWAWQNAGFEEGKGFLGMNLVTVVGLNENGLIKNSAPLEDCLERDGWADFESLNSQGLPTKKAPIQKYEPGKTFYFVKPENGSVARSYAISSRLSLYCDRDSSVRNPNLGVFAVFNDRSLAR